MAGRHALIFAAVLARAALSDPAFADEPPPESPPAAPVDPSRTRQTDPLRADQLFQEALALLDQGRWQEACPKFRESLAADPSVGTLLNVAACSVKEGDRLQAAREYRRVLELNGTTIDPERRKNVDATAREALEKLEAELGRITIRVAPADARARLRIDDREGARLGEAVELTTGKHRIVVEADGYQRAERAIDLAPGARDVLVVSLVREAPPTNAPSRAPSDRTLLTAGLVTGLAGTGLLVTGAVLLGLAGDRAAEIRAECGPGVDPPSCPLGDAAVADDLAGEGRAFATSGYVALGTGGAAVAAAIGLLIADATREEPVTAPRVIANVNPDEVGLWLVGRF